MKTLSFTKMHGLGNDFVIIDNRSHSLVFYPEIAAKIADRRKGIGADGVIIIDKPVDKTASCLITIFNSDGSLANACGNASRCIARLMLEETKKETVYIETRAGLIAGHKNKDLIAVNMGIPSFNWKDLPLSEEADTFNMPRLIPEISESCALLMGVPHLVCFVDDVSSLDVAKLGSQLEKNKLFTFGTNVDFIKIIDKQTIRMKVWERGAGITMACGTGACASFFAAYKKGFCINQTRVILDGGDLFIESLEDGSILMTGTATKVFTGELNIDEI
ncbi:MAG: diaminopimelate epimerase [Alphaproteobacteria bacterium]